MKDGQIQIRKARQNNLASVDVDIPRNRLVAITGVSGSGKSSLAFDTLFREGQRRFLETLSAYARQFLGRMEKPDVESIEGLSPAIAVDQKSVSRGARSTVGTLTEITDHLRVLFARAGTAHCPKCDLPVKSQTPEDVAQQILAELAGQNLLLLAPVIRDKKGHHKEVLEGLRKQGFVRARVDGVVARLEEVPELARYERHTIEVVVDRLKPEKEKPGRLREALEQGLELSGGDVIARNGGLLDLKNAGAWDTSRTTFRTESNGQIAFSGANLTGGTLRGTGFSASHGSFDGTSLAINSRLTAGPGVNWSNAVLQGTLETFHATGLDNVTVSTSGSVIVQNRIHAVAPSAAAASCSSSGMDWRPARRPAANAMQIVNAASPRSTRVAKTERIAVMLKPLLPGLGVIQGYDAIFSLWN